MPNRSTQEHSQHAVQEQHSIAASTAVTFKQEVLQSLRESSQVFGNNDEVDTLPEAGFPILVGRDSSNRFREDLPTAKQVRSKVLVPGSDDEDRVKVSIKRSAIRSANEERFQLSCVEPWHGVVVPIVHSAVTIYSDNETASPVGLEFEIPDSEDEHPTVRAEAKADGMGDNTHEPLGFILTPPATMLSLSPSRTLRRSDLSNDEPTETLAGHGSSSYTGLNPDDTNKQELANTADTPLSYRQNEAYPSVVRSYPLRERTFQQRKPYTADKQQHALFIGGRGSSTRLSESRGLIQEDFGLPIDNQDDGEDSDYEEQDLRAVNDPVIRATEHPYPKKTKRNKDVLLDLDFSLQDWDDDDLPTIEDLRHQFQSERLIGSGEPALQDQQQHFPRFKLPRPLSARATRKLERLAMQPLELLEPLDTVPEMTYHMNNRPMGSNPSSDADEDAWPPARISLPGSRPATDPVIDADDHMNYDVSSDDDSQLAPAKKNKKPRHHVLPAAFFKRNLLPDDAAALRSLRQQEWLRRHRSGTPDTITGLEPDQAPLAHHAKRRIATSKQGDSAFSEFIARLAQDKSASEDESAHSTLSEASYEQDPYDIAPGNDGMSWLSSKDTDGLRKRPIMLKPGGHINQRRSPVDVVSSDSEFGESPSGLDQEYGSRKPIISSYTSNNQARIRSGFREERLDMIDRMLVRPSNESSAPSSRKRRRVSGNLTSLKIRRSAHSSSLRSNIRLFKQTPENSRESDLGLESSASNETHGTTRDFGYRKRGKRITLENGNHDLFSDHGIEREEDFMEDERLSTLLDQDAHSDNVHLDYPVFRHDTATPKYQSKYRPRRLCNPKVVPRIRGPRMTPISSSRTRSRPAPIKPKKTKALLQETLYSHISLHPTASRPQLVNKPFFQPTSKWGDQRRLQDIATSPSATRAQQIHNNPYHHEGHVSMEEYTIPDQPWDDDGDPGLGQAPPSERLPAPLPASASLQWNHFMAGPRAIPTSADPKDFVYSDKAISNGLYFSRDTYIGRGMLSQLLRVMPMQTKLDTGAMPRAIFFGQPFTPKWDDISSVEHDLGSVLSTFRHHFRSLQEFSLSYDSGQLHNGLTSVSGLNVSLLALENMTTLLIERFTVSDPLECASFWRMFGSVVIGPLVALVEESQMERLHSPISILIVWTRWALASWDILADCAWLDAQEAVHRSVQSLMRQLLNASDAGFLMQLSKSLDPQQTSSGAIHGQDVTEIWVCLIQALNRYSELRGASRDFWTFFNREVRQIWLTNENSTGTSGILDGSMAQKDPMNHVMQLLLNICKLHQFARDGSSNPAIQTKENWALILLLLQKNWLDHATSENIEAERHLRRFLLFCHSRLHIWGWTPSADVAVYIYRFFASRGFRDMPTEHGYRLPEFLKRMATMETQTSSETDAALMDGPRTSIEFDPNMSLVGTVDKHDRCFEIFLKILARAIQWQVSEICADGEFVETLQTPSTVSQADMRDLPPSTQVTSYHLLSRTEKIKACKRMLSSISPAVVTTISASVSSEQTYSSLCNPCNLVLMVALLVPEFIRPSTVGQLRSLLNFESSDDAARRILLESVFYLGKIWQRQGRHCIMVGKNGRTLDKILDYFFGRLESMCQSLEDDLAIDASAGYMPRSKRQAPVAVLIESTLGYIARLLKDEGANNRDDPRYPPMAYLDQRLSRFLNPEVAYPAELRLQALGIVESFLGLRKSHEGQLRDLMAKQTKDSTKPPSAAVTNTEVELDHTAMTTEDGFSSLDYDLLVFDDNDFLDFSQSSDANEQGNQSSAPIADTDTPSPNGPLALEQDSDFAEIILLWIYPTIARFVRARHQALQEEQQQQARSTIPANLGQNQIGLAGFFAASLGTGSRDPASLDNPRPGKSANLTFMSLQGTWRLLGVYAECSIILLDQRCMKMEDVSSLFKRESWLSPWMQLWRLQDELVWAVRMAECCPRMVLVFEDVFLNVWFSTISLPVHELTVQHRLMKVLLTISDSSAATAIRDKQGSMPVLCYALFKDLPLGHLDYCGHGFRDTGRSMEGTDVDRSLMDATQDAKLLQEFKESRLQLVAKVLSNIGEHYLAVRPVAGSSNQTALHRAHSVKSRYQSYLSLLLNQLKRDYERLESRHMVREIIRHVELAHHVVGQVIQHCGLVMQNSQLAGPHDSILNFLTSSRYFPQPRVDGVFIHQKIRGYAYLYQAGEKHFFRDLLEMVLGLIKVIPSRNSFRFNWRSTKRYQETTTLIVVRPESGTGAEEGLDVRLGVRVFEGDITIYGGLDHQKPTLSTLPVRQQGESRSDEAAGDWISGISRSSTGTIPRLYRVQAGHSNAPGGSGLENHSASVRASSGDNSAKLSKIHPLFANHTNKQHSPQNRVNEALQTLTSSLRNVALEPEDRKQWNTVMGSFRVLAFISIFRPLLTAFLGTEDQYGQGYCSTFVSNDEDQVTSHSATRVLPRQPSLMVVSVPAIQWLVSLIAALSNDIEALSVNASTSHSPIPKTSTPAFEDETVLLALEGFQKETSMLFSSILQCLAGCFDMANARWIDIARTRLGEIGVQQEEADRFLYDAKDGVRAVHLFGQTMQAIEAIVKVARKIQMEHSRFYEQNMAWREALLELAQFALDHGFHLMMSLGGPMEDEHGHEEREVAAADGYSGDLNLGHGRFMISPVLDHLKNADRIPGAQDAASMEASFQEFLSNHTRFASFERMVYRELCNLPSLESWSGDILNSSNDSRYGRDDDAGVAASNDPRQFQGQLLRGTLHDRLKPHHWALWSFQSSFLNYCRSISTLDSRLHRQVQRALGVLLKSPSVSAGPLSRVERKDSVWYHILHHATDPSEGMTQASSWAELRWCMSREWQLFLSDWSEVGSAMCAGDRPRELAPMSESIQDPQVIFSSMPGIDSVFV